MCGPKQESFVYMRSFPMLMAISEGTYYYPHFRGEEIEDQWLAQAYTPG